MPGMVICCYLNTTDLCANFTYLLFTFIAHKKCIFLLHSSQKYCNFAFELKQEATITIKPQTQL